MNPFSVNASISSRFALELVFNWSGWISSQHDSPERAWDVECSNLSEEVVADNGHTDHVLRPAAWDTLWLRWLEERENGNVTLVKEEEAALSFKYVDKLEVEDDLVSKPEFTVAFNLAATELSSFPFCVFLHDRFWNSSQAWVATAGSENALNMSRWSSLWADYTPPFDFSKPSSSASFHYLDADANGLVSQSEFASFFGLCHNTPTRSVSTTSAMSTKTSMTHSSSGSTSTTSSWTRVTFTSTTSSVVVHEVNQHCCNEVSAECLSCIAGITIEELCSQDSMSLTPGCQGAPAVSAQAAPGGPHANAKVSTSTTLPPHFAEVSDDGSQAAKCPFSGIAFSPILPGFKESQEDLAGCQARCLQSMGCGFFTFWRSTRLCKLHPITAVSTPDLEAVSGPPCCVARFQAHISSVDFRQLSMPQINNLHASLPDLFAQHWKIPTSKVQDVEGHPRAVTLLQGSLLVEGKVLLPAGTAIADLAQKSRTNLQLRKKVSKLLLSNDIPFEVEVGAEDVEAELPFSMAIEANPGCFLEQTEYHSEEQEKVMADSVMDCQKTCALSEVCSVFTFFPQNQQCYLTGKSFSAASNEAALSGPAKCPAISLARMQGLDLPGQLVAGSESTLEAVEQVPMVYLLLTGLVFLGLLVP